MGTFFRKIKILTLKNIQNNWSKRPEVFPEFNFLLGNPSFSSVGFTYYTPVTQSSWTKFRSTIKNRPNHTIF